RRILAPASTASFAVRTCVEEEESEDSSAFTRWRGGAPIRPETGDKPLRHRGGRASQIRAGGVGLSVCGERKWPPWTTCAAPRSAHPFVADNAAAKGCGLLVVSALPGHFTVPEELRKIFGKEKGTRR